MATQYETYTVGSGDAYIRDLSQTPVVPLPVGAVSDFSLSQAIETTELPTQDVTNQAGVVVGVKYTGKMKMGGTYGAQLRALIANGSKAAGMEVVASETKTAAASFALTSVTGFVKTLAMFDSYNHLMSPVASGPTASTSTVPGTYIDLGTGSYTMSGTQSGNVTAKWLKTDSATGFTVSPVNATQGAAATFVEIICAYKAKLSTGATVEETIRIPQAQITKLDQASKPKAANEWDMEFDVFCDTNNKPWYRSIAQ
jgi:hypothetical protein